MQAYPVATVKNTFFIDVLFLLIISSLLQFFIIRGLGFCSDDWVFMSIFHNSKDASLVGLMKSLFAEAPVVVRPVFVLQLSVLYKLFGLNPLGYHVTNSLVIILEVIFFYLGLRKLDLSRIITVAIPLIYILLPHYSTTHIWVACFNANLSMAFFFLNFYANLKFVDYTKYTINNWLWLVLALISLVIIAVSRTIYSFCKCLRKAIYATLFA